MYHPSSRCHLIELFSFFFLHYKVNTSDYLRQPTLWPYRPIFFANDWAQPIKWPSSRNILIAFASLSGSPLAKPWYAISKNGKWFFDYMQTKDHLSYQNEEREIEYTEFRSKSCGEHYLEKAGYFSPLLLRRINSSWIMCTCMKQEKGSIRSILETNFKYIR